MEWKTQNLQEQKKRTVLQSTGRESSKVRIENHTSAVNSCEFHKSGLYIVSANSEGEIQICPTDTGSEKLSYLKGHKEEVTEVHYSSDGLSVYSGSLDRTVGIWDAFVGKRKAAIIGHSDRVNTVQCTRSPKPLLCSGSSDKTIRVWDIRERNCSGMFRSQHEVWATCFSGCGKYIFSGGLNNGDITAWDMRQNEAVHVMLGHGHGVTGLALSPCKKYLASCSTDGTLRQWDVGSPETGKEVKRFALDQGDVGQTMRRCSWSAAGALLSAGTSGGQVIVFDVSSGERLFELDGHNENAVDVAFHPKKNILCSAGMDSYLILHYLD